MPTVSRVGNHADIQPYLDHLRLRNLRPNTIRLRAQVLTLLARYLQPTFLCDATAEQLDGWQQSLTVLSPATRRAYVQHVQLFYRWAYEEALIESDPTRRLVRPRNPGYKPRPISDQDLTLALACADPPVRQWLVLAAFCGLRACEIAGLKRSDLLHSNVPPLLFIAEGKGGKPRTVPFPKPVQRELGSFMGQGKLFRTTPAQVSNRTNRYLRSVGLSVTLHQFRHTYATRLYQMSKDPRMVMDVLGHGSLATVAIYADYEGGSATAAAAKWAEQLNSWPTRPLLSPVA